MSKSLRLHQIWASSPPLWVPVLHQRGTKAAPSRACCQSTVGSISDSWGLVIQVIAQDVLIRHHGGLQISMMGWMAQIFQVSGALLCTGVAHLQQALYFLLCFQQVSPAPAG